MSNVNNHCVSYKSAGGGSSDSSESNGNEAADKRNRGRKRLAKVAAVADPSMEEKSARNRADNPFTSINGDEG